MTHHSRNGAPASLAEWQRTLGALCNGHKATPPKVSPFDANNKGLSVYRNNVLGTRVNVIEQTFPLLAKLLGRDYLRQCAKHFIQQCERNPTTQFERDLNTLGAGFPAYIKELQKNKKELKLYPWLADLAQLDYQLHCIYYSKDDSSFNFEEFQNHSSHTDRLFFTLSSSLYLLSSNWPLGQIHQDIQALTIQNSYPEHPQTLCLYRKGLEPSTAILSNDEFSLLCLINDHTDMDTLMAQTPQNPEHHAEQLLPQWIQRGWICGFDLKPVKISTAPSTRNETPLNQQTGL